jgi:hypothetical protein
MVIADSSMARRPDPSVCDVRKRRDAADRNSIVRSQCSLSAAKGRPSSTTKRHDGHVFVCVASLFFLGNNPQLKYKYLVFDYFLDWYTRSSGPVA